MTTKRVSAPLDLKKSLQSDDDPPPKKAAPPRKPFTNGLFRPLKDNQIDMLEREYYTNKNMVAASALT